MDHKKLIHKKLGVCLMVENKISEDLMWSPLQKELLKMLERNGPMTRKDLVKTIDKPRTTVYDNLMGLIQHNLVRKYSRPTNSRGRPLVFFKLSEE
jgi:predicted transcriptional regulator